jgi:formylglycine-generating enzyme required for sulfatase activity
MNFRYSRSNLRHFCPRRKSGVVRFLFAIGFAALASRGLAQTTILTSSGTEIVIKAGSLEGVRTGMTGYVYEDDAIEGKIAELKVARFVIATSEEHVSVGRVTASTQKELKGLRIQFDQPLGSGESRGRLRLACEPTDSLVTVDGIARGFGSGIVLEVEPGNRKVEVDRPGFRPATASPLVEAGKEVEVPCRLTPLWTTPAELFELAEKEFREGHLDRAERLYLDHLSLDLESNRSVNRLVELRREIGQVKLRREIDARLPGLLAEAEAAIASGTTQPAIEIAERILKADPMRTEGRVLKRKAYFTEARRLFEKGESLVGLESLEKALALAPEDAELKALRKEMLFAVRSAEMVRLEGGGVQVGCVPKDDCPSYELPRHDLKVEPFYLDVHEVTVAAYERCVKAGGCKAPSAGAGCNWGVAGRENHAMNCVSWEEANGWARWAGKRLPTEGEFEYAIRAKGVDKIYPWGDEEKPAVGSGNLTDASWAKAHPGEEHLALDYTDGAVESAPVPFSKPNGFGISDLVGNVSEWVSDCWEPSPPTRATAVATTTGSPCELRVFRGGSWKSGLRTYRNSQRARSTAVARFPDVGFRCAYDGER